MKKQLHYAFYKILLPACGIYTFLTIIFYIFGRIGGFSHFPLDGANVVKFLGVSMGYAVCGWLFKLKGKISRYMILLSHYIATSGVTAFFLFALPKLTGAPDDVVAAGGAAGLFFIYISVYAIAFLVYVIVTLGRERKKSMETTYKKRF